jgi:hypothetical protein
VSLRGWRSDATEAAVGALIGLLVIAALVALSYLVDRLADPREVGGSQAWEEERR